MAEDRPHEAHKDRENYGPEPPAPGAPEARPPEPPAEEPSGGARADTPQTDVPAPAEPPGKELPGVQRTRQPRHAGDTFGLPSNAVPGKPDGETDTRR
jgi:hypothetical protein